MIKKNRIKKVDFYARGFTSKMIIDNYYQMQFFKAEAKKAHKEYMIQLQKNNDEAEAISP